MNKKNIYSFEIEYNSIFINKYNETKVLKVYGINKYIRKPNLHYYIWRFNFIENGYKIYNDEIEILKDK